ncbi:MAG: hypothetical protein ABIQ57_04945 [Candidatus Kapaibacterium sp.]
MMFLLLLSACGNSTHGSARNGKDSSAVSAVKISAPDSTRISHLKLDGRKGGCGFLGASAQFNLFAGDTASKNFMVVNINQQICDLRAAPRLIDLRDSVAGFTVTLERFSLAEFPRYCDDYHEHRTPEIWKATGGTLAISRVADQPVVTARLNNLSFRSLDGTRTIAIDSANFVSIDIGVSGG